VNRREFITLMGGAAAAWPLAARAQQHAMPVIGFLSMRSAQGSTAVLSSFSQGLSEAGFEEGRNVAIEYRWAEGRNERIVGFASEFVRRPVSAITVFGTAAIRAAKAATSTIPIVFLTGDDPVAAGLVTNFSRPGGNLTGVTFVSATLAAKRLGLLRELVPNAETIALLVNPTSPESQAQSRDAQDAARALGQRLIVVEASNDSEIDMALAGLGRQRAAAMLVSGSPFFASRINRLVALAARHALPAMYQFRDFAVAGGLISYGASLTEAYRQVGLYAGRVLKGEKPGDLPVMQPTKFEFVLNLKTAKALGLDVPDKVLALADEVIE
jgi:putative ABC transport system substrate-binding protein